MYVWRGTGLQWSADADNRSAVDPKHSAGLPIGLQVVGYRFEDQQVMEATRLIATAMGAM